jgi:RsiW-degrading membrane proteinase PrsW (M82 family)
MPVYPWGTNGALLSCSLSRPRRSVCFLVRISLGVGKHDRIPVNAVAECFLFGFVVPILPYMLETRLHHDPSRTQHFTTTLLTIYGAVSLVSAPFVAHFADKTPSRKIPLLLSLSVCASGTVLVACATTGTSIHVFYCPDLARLIKYSMVADGRSNPAIHCQRVCVDCRVRDTRRQRRRA